MSFKEVIAVKGFWKSVVILGIAFMLIYNVIDLLFSYGFNFDEFVAEKLSGPMLFRFLIANILGGLIYGFIVTFLQFRSKLKREKQRQ
ncbi:hypothetical protein [Mesonia aestuariivivens]|uniref:DUF1049 domain-containing protein n=1 Tax=Mesonia aestuariivivens TaxID=2796128 RepID=A0ABS6W561_9FLAO|nr:hypothetical protein [Mesonia aestuariivivens]MBW2962657.1 hypothetical protein [Mesonia aestuariivivens]